jgi:FAD-linked oxidoreductase
MTGLTRRELLRAVTLGVGAAGLAACSRSSIGAAAPVPEWSPGAPLPWRNWSGIARCVPQARLVPADESEVQALLRSGSGALRPAGAGHSFSGLVPCDESLVFLDRLQGVIASDAAARSAEVWTGTRLWQLGPALAALGQALPNQPDIDYQTLGGALATSTHGTGATLGSLSSYVSGLALATPSGELLECDAQRNAELFHAARVSLGALGVVTRVRLQNRAAFRLVERSRFVPLESLLAELTGERDAHPHFEFYAFPHAEVALAIATDPDDGSGAPAATAGEDDPEAVLTLRAFFRFARALPGGGRLYDAFLRRQPASARAGASHEVLAHPRTVRFNEMEYTVPAESGPECLRAVLAEIHSRDLPICFPIECRFIRADDAWLSMFQGRPGFSISIHQFADEDWRPYFAAIEPIFWRYEGRPHWGKLHSLDAPRLAALYPHWSDFQRVRRSLDPGGRLVNAHLAQIFGV